MLGKKHISNVLRYVGNDLPQLTDRVTMSYERRIKSRRPKEKFDEYVNFMECSVVRSRQSYRYQKQTTKKNG